MATGGQPRMCPRKFSEKIALLNRNMAEGNAKFEEIIKEVQATRTVSTGPPGTCSPGSQLEMSLQHQNQHHKHPNQLQQQQQQHHHQHQQQLQQQLLDTWNIEAPLADADQEPLSPEPQPPPPPPSVNQARGPHYRGHYSLALSPQSAEEVEEVYQQLIKSVDGYDERVEPAELNYNQPANEAQPDGRTGRGPFNYGTQNGCAQSLSGCQSELVDKENYRQDSGANLHQYPGNQQAGLYQSRPQSVNDYALQRAPPSSQFRTYNHNDQLLLQPGAQPRQATSADDIPRARLTSIGSALAGHMRYNPGAYNGAANSHSAPGKAWLEPNSDRHWHKSCSDSALNEPLACQPAGPMAGAFSSAGVICAEDKRYQQHQQQPPMGLQYGHTTEPTSMDVVDTGGQLEQLHQFGRQVSIKGRRLYETATGGALPDALAQQQDAAAAVDRPTAIVSLLNTTDQHSNSSRSRSTTFPPESNSGPMIDNNDNNSSHNNQGRAHQMAGNKQHRPRQGRYCDGLSQSNHNIRSDLPGIQIIGATDESASHSKPADSKTGLVGEGSLPDLAALQFQSDCSSNNSINDLNNIHNCPAWGPTAGVYMLAEQQQQQQQQPQQARAKSQTVEWRGPDQAAKTCIPSSQSNVCYSAAYDCSETVLLGQSSYLATNGTGVFVGNTDQQLQQLTGHPTTTSTPTTNNNNNITNSNIVRSRSHSSIYYMVKQTQQQQHQHQPLQNQQLLQQGLQSAPNHQPAACCPGGQRSAMDQLVALSAAGAACNKMKQHCSPLYLVDSSSIPTSPQSEQNSPGSSTTEQPELYMASVEAPSQCYPREQPAASEAVAQARLGLTNGHCGGPQMARCDQSAHLQPQYHLNGRQSQRQAIYSNGIFSTLPAQLDEPTLAAGRNGD